MTLFRRSRTGPSDGRARLLVQAALAALLAAAVPGAVAQAGTARTAGAPAADGGTAVRRPAWSFDVQAVPRAVLSWDGLAPVLPHAGFSLAAGGELRAGAWIPARIQLEYFHVFPSAVSSAGDLYRSWAGWDLSLASGARVLSRERGPPLGLDLLGGVSFGAARYPGTTVAFASFSADLTARADFTKPGSGGWRAVLPLAYIFRPGVRSFSAGLGASYALPPLRKSGASPGGAE